MRRRLTGSALVAGAAVLLAACGSTTTTTTSSTTTTSISNGATNLAVTPAIRTALLAAGAALHSLPVSDFTGLRAGMTYYAYDSVDSKYWAGAQLAASPSSTPAQVSTQDDGSYTLFTRPAHGGTWVAYNDGLGTLAHTSCSAVVPANVRAVWHWSQSAPCGGPPS